MCVYYYCIKFIYSTQEQTDVEQLVFDLEVPFVMNCHSVCSARLYTDFALQLV